MQATRPQPTPAHGVGVLSAVLVAALSAWQLRHGITPALDTVSYWSGAEAFAHGHGFTTTLAPSFSNFSAIDVLQRGGRLPFTDFPLGYPLLAGSLGALIGTKAAMVALAVAALAVAAALVVIGPRSLDRSWSAALCRAPLAVGLAMLPITRLTAAGVLSEPLFVAVLIGICVTTVNLADGHGRGWLAAALVAAAGLLRFLGAALGIVVLLVAWRRRGARVAHLAALAAVAWVPVAANVAWSAGVGSGHRFGWRSLDSLDRDFTVRSVAGWVSSHFGDIAQTYFGADRSLPWWAWLITIAWVVAVACGLVLVGRGAAPRVAVPLAAAAMLGGALLAAMLTFDSLVKPDNRLMLPMGAATITAAAWAMRPTGRRATALLLAAAVAWVALSGAPSTWMRSPRPTVHLVAPPTTLPDGRPVAVIVTPEADIVHWQTHVPSVYAPLPTKQLTGETVDLAATYAALPCALYRHAGVLLVVTDGLFGIKDVALIDEQVRLGHLVEIPAGSGRALTGTAASCPPAGG